MSTALQSVAEACGSICVWLDELVIVKHKEDSDTTKASSWLEAGAARGQIILAKAIFGRLRTALESVYQANGQTLNPSVLKSQRLKRDILRSAGFTIITKDERKAAAQGKPASQAAQAPAVGADLVNQIAQAIMAAQGMAATAKAADPPFVSTPLQDLVT